MEPPHLKVTVIQPDEPLDELIPEALRGRPELAAQQALVKATIERLKQEKMRPLIPSLVLQGAANPGDTLGAGYYEANLAGSNPTWTGRSDWDFQVVWQLQNLGAGNTGLVHERRGEERQATVELFRIQDQVAAEVTQAFADVEAATARMKEAEYGLSAAEVSFAGNLKGLSETIRTGDTLQLVVRPQKSARPAATAASLRQLLHQRERFQPRRVPLVSRAGVPGATTHVQQSLGRAGTGQTATLCRCHAGFRPSNPDVASLNLATMDD